MVGTEWMKYVTKAARRATSTVKKSIANGIQPIPMEFVSPPAELRAIPYKGKDGDDDEMHRRVEPYRAAAVDVEAHS